MVDSPYVLDVEIGRTTNESWKMQCTEGEEMHKTSRSTRKNRWPASGIHPISEITNYEKAKNVEDTKLLVPSLQISNQQIQPSTHLLTESLMASGTTPTGHILSLQDIDQSNQTKSGALQLSKEKSSTYGLLLNEVDFEDPETDESVDGVIATHVIIDVGVVDIGCAVMVDVVGSVWLWPLYPEHKVTISRGEQADDLAQRNRKQHVCVVAAFEARGFGHA